jgi:hypothetical protein
MRALPCPHCDSPLSFSWADFIFLSTRGRAPLFCLSCKKMCTTSSTTGSMSFFASLLAVGAPVYVLFFSGLFSFPEWSKAVAIIVAVPVVMVARAYFMERFADELVVY